MKQEALKFFTDIHLTVIGLTVFFSYFIIVIIKTMFISKETYHHLTQIPFENENFQSNQNVLNNSKTTPLEVIHGSK